jgi:hypothetical protein
MLYGAGVSIDIMLFCEILFDAALFIVPLSFIWPMNY